jgi:type VI secretion system secreted protein VgrG
MTAWRSDQAIFTFQTSGYPDELRVVGVSGNEGMCDLFHFGIELAARDNEIDLDAVVGSPAQLDIHYADGARKIFGIISRFEQGIAGETFTPYYAELVPTVWLLTQRYRSQIFQEMTVKEIIEKVLTDARVESNYFRFALQRASYIKRDYCVQYRETSWNFISRLMEEEGIFHFFEHIDGRDVLVMADSDQVHVPIPGTSTVVFRDPSGMVEAEEFVHSFRYSQQIRPGKVALRDYNFEHPTLDLTKETSAERDASLEVYDHPGLYLEEGPGGETARIRLEAAQSQRLLGTGQSLCRRLATGSTFELEDHPRASLNQKYLLIWVQHEGVQPLGQDEGGGRFSYNNRFRCIPFSTPYRPVRKTPKPVVEGSQTAVVTGPAGEETYVDKYGRVKVKFPWDREGHEDEKSSCWIRVSQLWAGAGWGAMFIPRIGHEVIVDFLEGDPDRPIITGRVYNADNMPPYALDTEKTRSTIKSDSTKGHGGSNEYRFEDLKGSEEIYQHAQKDLTIKTEHDKNQQTGHDETLSIGHDRKKDVGNDESTGVGHNRTESVGHDESITIGNDRTESVENNERISIGKNRNTDVGKNEDVLIGDNRTEEVTKDEKITIGQNRTESVGKDEKLEVGGNRFDQIAKDDKQKIGKKFALVAGDEILLQTGDASIVMKKDGTIQIKGKDITVVGSGKIGIKASSDLTLKGSKIAEN